jgi:signal peptidase II
MIIFIISISVVAVDQISKKLISINLLPGQSKPIIENIFCLTLVHNKGVAFGLFSERAAFFVFISIIVVLLIIVSFQKIKGYGLLLKVGLSLILGGAVGNLIDRFMFGYVIDFLDFRIWPVFNIADSAITIGAGLLVIYLLKLKESKSASTA